MSDAALIALGIFELIGLAGLYILVRKAAERKAERARAPRWARIATALLGLPVVVANEWIH